MDVKSADPHSLLTDGPTSVTAELYFLIARLLEAGPCRNASEALKRELEVHGLLPKRLDWLGNQHEQTFEELCRRFSHITSNHLLQICNRVGPLVDKDVPNNVRGVRSLLGAGRQSVLRQKEDLVKKLHRERYVVRQNSRPRCNPVDLVGQPGVVPLLQSRELTGSIDHHNAAPSRIYGRVQQFCRTLGHLSAVYCVLFDRTGNYIFTGADDLLVKIWSALTGRLLATLRGASAEIADLAVSYDNTLLAAGSCDKIVRVWCLRTTAPIAVLTGHGGTITSINFCPADRGAVRYLASTSSDGSVSFWEYVCEPGQNPKFFPRPHKFNERMRPGQAQMLCASFSPGGMFLATGCADHHVRVYAMFGQEGPERILEKEIHSDRVDSIQWANQGLRFISGSKDGTALLWRYEKAEWRTIKLRMTSRLTGPASSGDNPSEDDADARNQKLKVTMVTWSRDDRWLITAVSDFSIKVWDSITGSLHKELRGHEGETFVLEPHPHDPNVLLSAGHDGRLLIWDLAKGEVMKSFLNFIEGQGHGAVFDAKWSPSGTTIAATDSHGHLSIYGIGATEKFKKLPKAIFFHTDYRPLIRDAHHHVLDEQTQLAPHLMPPPFLVDSEGNPYPPHLQRLVPGRELLKDDQLVPIVIVNANGEQEILASGAQAADNAAAAPAAGAADGEAAGAAPLAVAPVVMPPPPPQRARSNIDQMIAELAHQQERQRNRPRSSSSSTSASSSAAAPVGPVAVPSAEHSYAVRIGPSRALSNVPSSLARAAELDNSADGEAVDENSQPDQAEEPSAALPTEATPSEALPGFSRRCIVKALTPGQLTSYKAERQGWADEEVNLFDLEVQRKSPNIFLGSAVSPGITALHAARSFGAGDQGWSPSRPRRRTQNNQRERNTNFSSPARSRVPHASPAARSRGNQSQQQNQSQSQPQQQHSYRTRSNRTESTRRQRNGATRERSRRVVVRMSSSDEGGEDEEQQEEQLNTGSEAEGGVEMPRTRSQGNHRQRNDGALSTSDSEESDSDLASELLDSDSESQDGSSSSSSEYSDWTAEAGVNLEPPKRTRRKAYRRPRCLSTDEDGASTSGATSAAAGAAGAPATAATAGASGASGAANNEADEGEGSNSSPPAPRKKKMPVPRPGKVKREIPESFRPSEWLSEVVPRRTPYYPQMGDEIFYFRPGHELYVKAVNDKKVFELAQRSLPWSRQTIRDQELVKVIGIKYEIKPPRLCCLKLGMMDPTTGALTGESFTLKYHDVADVLDFLVLRQTYDLALLRKWNGGDHFRCIIDDLWWEGQLEQEDPFQPERPDSMFLCYKIRWDNNEGDRISPWDMEPVDPDRRPTQPGTGVPVLPEEMACTLYQPRAEDWPPGGDRDAECDRIGAAISQVMSLAIAEPFVAPVDLNMYPTYAYIVEYPIDLSTIKARLENRFYRRVTAVQYDVRYIYTNACKFNQEGSEIVRHASIITDLCMEIIRNRDVEDCTAVYHRIVENYRASPDEDGSGPSTSRDKRFKGKKNGLPQTSNTPKTRSMSARNSPADSDPDSDDNEPDGPSKSRTSANRSKDKRISTRMAAAATLSWKQQCKELVDTLSGYEDSIPFQYPVNVVDHPDYLQAVDHPMDLSTVREELNVGNYLNPNEFAKDVRLIFENSKNYNTNKKSRIYAMTVRLSAVFEEKIRPILSSFRSKKKTNGASKSQRSSKSKGKALARPHSKSTSSREAKVNGDAGSSRQGLKIVLSRGNTGQISVQPSSSSSQALDVAASARRRILEDDDDEDEEEQTPEVPTEPHVNGNCDPHPGPSGVSMAGTNGTAKRGLKRRILSDEDSDEEEDEKPQVAEERSDKGKTLKKPQQPPAALMPVKKEEPESSSDEDDKPISMRRRVAVAKPAIQVRVECDGEEARPTSSSSSNSNSSNSSNHFSVSREPNGQSLRRSERRRRPPKRPLDSEPSEHDGEEEEEDFDELERKRKRRAAAARRTRNGGKRTVRYREDSDEENRRGNSRGRSSRNRNPSKVTTDEDDDDEEEEENEDGLPDDYYGDGIGKRKSRKSAQEAAKRFRPNPASDEENDEQPTLSVSSRGRIRKIIHTPQELYD